MRDEPLWQSALAGLGMVVIIGCVAFGLVMWRAA